MVNDHHCILSASGIIGTSVKFMALNAVTVTNILSELKIQNLFYGTQAAG
jgi:hypothetical protein